MGKKLIHDPYIVKVVDFFSDYQEAFDLAFFAEFNNAKTRKKVIEFFEKYWPVKNGKEIRVTCNESNNIPELIDDYKLAISIEFINGPEIMVLYGPRHSFSLYYTPLQKREEGDNIRFNFIEIEEAE